MSDIGKIIRVNALPPPDKRENNVIYQVAAPGAATYKDYAIDANGDLKTPSYIPLTGTVEGKPLTKNIEVDPNQEGAVGFISNTPDLSKAALTIQEDGSVLAESRKDTDNISSSIHLHHDTGIEITATTSNNQFSAIIDTSGLQGDNYIPPSSDEHYVQKKYITDNFTSQTTFNNTLVDYYTSAETDNLFYDKTEVDAKLSAVYRPKGSVANFASLPSSGNTEGDVWNVLDTGANYVWVTNLNNTGVAGWDKLSETVDLTNYMTLNTEQIASARKIFNGASGNRYDESAIETRGIQSAGIFPTIGFHQPGNYAGTISLRNINYFHFRNTDDSDFNFLLARGYVKDASSDSYILLGGGGHKAISDFIDKTSTQSITDGLKLFYTTGSDYTSTTLHVVSSTNVPSIAFQRVGVGAGQLKYDGEQFFFANDTGTSVIPILALEYRKSGSDNSYVLLGGGGHKPASDFALSYQLENYHKIDPVGSIADGSAGRPNTSWFDYTWAGISAMAGSVINFSGLYGNYATELFADYFTGQDIGVRTHNGDMGNWNPVRWLWHSGNLPNPASISDLSAYVPITGNSNVWDVKTFSGPYTQWLLNGDGTTNARGFAQSLSGRFLLGTLNDKDVAFYRNAIEKIVIGNLTTTFNTNVASSGYVIANNVALGDVANYVRINRQSANDLGVLSESNGFANIISAGFKRSGSDDSYILTGGGGHVALSTKANAMQNATGVGFSSGNLPTNNGVEYPYFYYNNGNDQGFIPIATQGWVNYRFDNLSNDYVSLTGAAQSITSSKTFNSSSQVTFQGNDQNNVIVHKTSAGVAGLVSGHEYTHYNTRWRAGNKRGDGTNSLGFSFEFSNDGGATYTEKARIDEAGFFTGNAFASPVITGAQVFNANNTNQLFFGNDVIPSVFYQTLGNHIFQVNGNIIATMNSGGVAVTGALSLNGSDVITEAQRGAANGFAPLGTDSKISSAYLPSYVDDVLEFTNLTAFPTTGESGKIYVALDTNLTYRWGGSSYILISSGAVQSVNGQTGVVNLSKTDIGLANVDNTLDATKNVLSATKWTTPRTLSYTGDVTGSASVDGSGNVGFAMTLANSGVSAGTYNSVNVDAKGRVLSGNTINYVTESYLTTFLQQNYFNQAASDERFVNANGDEAINGNKTFTSSPSIPAAINGDHAVNLEQLTASLSNVVRDNDDFEILEIYRLIDSNQFDLDDTRVKKYNIVFEGASNGSVNITHLKDNQYYQFSNVSGGADLRINVEGYGAVDAVSPGKTAVYMSWGGGKLLRISENDNVSII